MCRKMGEYLCPDCFARISFDIQYKCLICERPSWDGMTHPKCIGKYTIDGYFSAVAYRNVIKKMLYQFKYQPYLFDLQSIITDLLYENLIQNELFENVLKTSPVLIPIPLSKKKLRKRGYNQAELLAKNIAKRFGLRTIDCLARLTETKPQYGLSREERIENIKGAFGIREGAIADVVRQSPKSNQTPSSLRTPRNDVKTALLVDDVLTTGSTLKEAASILKRNGFEKVWAVTFAQD